jgi:hypothetical protein
MNEYFNKYADLTALSLTFALPLLFTIYLKIKAQKRIRAVPAYFLFFGPFGILSFIFFHLFENSYRAIEATVNSHFTYNFHFYSLILFGVVVASLGALYLKSCIDKCLSVSSGNRSYFFKVLLMLLITVPLIPITPIAAVPAICCSVSILALPFVRKKRNTNSKEIQKAHDYYSIEQPTIA